MNKTILFFIAVSLTVSSCNLFNKEIKPIDFASLDRYPVFQGCDSTAVADSIKICFEKSIVAFIQKDLDTCKLMNQAFLKDTGVIIHLDVLRDGSCQVAEIEKINEVEAALPELRNQITLSVANIPTMTPGKKIGQSVNARFMIPLYIEKNTVIDTTQIQ